MSAATQERPDDAVKAPVAPRQRTSDVSPVKWPINAKYGLGRDSFQYVVYQVIQPKSGKQRRGSHQFRPIAYFPDLTGALLHVVKRQVFFDGEPTISGDLLDAFQSYCKHLDRIKADIAALAKRLEMVIERQES